MAFAELFKATGEAKHKAIAIGTFRNIQARSANPKGQYNKLYPNSRPMKSFYGWYYPHESGLKRTIDETTIGYVNRCSQKAKALTPKALTLIAPYGTKDIIPDDDFVRQLKRLDIDIMAYQDEVGVWKTKAGAAWLSS